MNRRLPGMRRLGPILGCMFLLALPLSAHEGIHEQIEQISQRIRTEPRNAALFLQRGELYRLHGDLRRARWDYDRAERLDPELVSVDLMRGRMYLDGRRPGEAKKALDRYLERRPDDLEGLTTRAEALAGAGDLEGAVRDLSAAIAVAPEPGPELYIERSRLLVKLRNPEKALEGIEEGIEQLGPIVTLELFAIEIETDLKRWDSALARLAVIEQQSPRKESWLARRGELLRSAGRDAEARAAYRSALAAILALPPAHRNARSTVTLEEQVHNALRILSRH